MLGSIAQVAIGSIWGGKTLVGGHFGIGTQSGETKVNNGLFIFTSQRTLKNDTLSSETDQNF